MDVSDKDNEVFAFDCKAIKDECNTTWYGVYFYKYSPEKGEYVVHY